MAEVVKGRERRKIPLNTKAKLRKYRAEVEAGQPARKRKKKTPPTVEKW